MPKIMPKIMYGTAWKKEKTTDLVVQAITAGFRGVDTACQPKHYREELVGKALKQVIAEGIAKREDLFIQTKYTPIGGQDTSQPLPYDASLSIADQVRQSVQKSLSNLGLEYIDSIILHSPLDHPRKTMEAYTTLESFVDSGKILALGISNCYDSKMLQHIMDHARIQPSVVQNRWYEGNSFDWKVYNLCQKHSIRYQSFWTLTGNPTLLSQSTLLALSERIALTPEQTLYRLCQVWNITPLCGSTALSHVKEALEAEACQEIQLDTPEVKELWDLMH